MIEFKAPYPNDDLPLEPYYKIPSRHVPQVLCQLAYLDAEELWLICCTTKTVTVIVVYYSEPLWSEIVSVADELYSEERKSISTHLHPMIQKIKEEVKKFIETHCTFILEVPTTFGSYASFTTSELGSLYYVSPLVDVGKPK